MPAHRHAPPQPAHSPKASASAAKPGDNARCVFDALSFAQAPLAASRLADLLAQGQWMTDRGTVFYPLELSRALSELQLTGQVLCDDHGRWLADPALGWRRFRALLDDPVARERWWAAWRGLLRFDTSWHVEPLPEAQMVGALRVVVLAGGTPQAYERLQRLAGGVTPSPVLIAMALLQPFDAALWQRMDPELQLTLLRPLLQQLPIGDTESVTEPLWQWLSGRASGADQPPLHDFIRYALATRLVLCGRTDDARRVAAELEPPGVDALRAIADIADGRYEAGARAFEAALKRRAADTGRRKQLFGDPLSWAYAVSLLAASGPDKWTAARRFVAAEAGRRDADPYTFWGIWQTAIEQRLGDAPRSIAPFRLAVHPAARLTGVHQLSHLLLAAWLGHRPAKPAQMRELLAQLDRNWRAAGLHWLALLTRRAGALLLGEPPAAGDATAPFPIAAAAEPWRQALDAIVALGAPAGGGAAARADGGGDRLLWLLRADAAGRLREVQVSEQKAGPRGLGKAKPVSLATLVKRANLPAHDAAVLRAVSRSPFGGKLLLDAELAVQSLVRHPNVAWHDAPTRPIELSEGLPQLEVLTRGEFLQFRVVDPIRPLPHHALDADDEDLDDDDDGYYEDDEDRFYRTSRGRGDSGKPPVLLFRDGDERARLVRVTPAQLRVAELVTQGWQVPTAARSEIDAALRVLGSHFQLASDADTGHQVPASAVLHAELTPEGDGLLLHLVASPFGDFGPRLAPGSGRERATTVHQGVTLSTRRDLAAERTALLALTRAVDWLDDGDNRWLLDQPEQALAVVEALAGLAPGIVTEWPKGKPLRVRAVTRSQIKLRVNGHGEWLALDGELAFDGGEVLRLGKLLDLLQMGRGRFVALGDGEFLALTDTLRQQLADLQAIAQPQGQGSRVAAMAALAWAAQPDAPALLGDAEWRQRLARWEQAQQQVFALPAGVQAELRDYQLAGWRWLMRLAASGFGAVLADDMGLGKTLQTLALLAARAGDGPALVVAPTSVTGNWMAEAARFTPGLKPALYGDLRADADLVELESADADAADAADPGTDGVAVDSARQAARRQQILALGAGDLLVCSYGLLQRDAALLAGRRWHTLVLDEAQAIKNAVTRRARAAVALDADCRVALTGTPVENRLAELWSIMAFANPGLLGSAEAFNRRFSGPIERDGDVQAGRRLRRIVAPFLLRRTKAEVLADLPPRTEIVLPVVPGSRERALLEALRRQAEEQVAQVLAGADAPGAGTGQAQMHILAALTRLRRAACDPRLAAPELGLIGAKVQAFEQLALELVAGRHKALVFSQFTDFLALLRERLDSAGLRYQYLDGSTPQLQRMQRVDAFQSGDGDFFLISLKAGGFGLNLTMADYVIIADPWWNPAAEDQASGRAHRIGQQRPVTVYRLVTQGSIEERIVKLHHSKRALADGVLAGQDGGGAALGAGELLALLRGDPADPPDPAAAGEAGTSAA